MPEIEKKELPDREEDGGEDKQGVVEKSPDSSKKDKDVEPESDKDKNFGILRQKSEALEKENAELKRKLEEKEADDARSRSLKDDEDPEEGKDKEKKKEEPSSEALKVAFDRDMKTAVKRWNERNKVSSQEWSEIKKRVSLKGDELLDEILEKIQSAYESIPEVKKKREEDLIKKGQQQAMQQFQDDELDLGGGGDGNFGGGSGGETRLNSKEKNFLKKFGVTEEEAKNIDKNSDAHRNWTSLEKQKN